MGVLPLLLVAVVAATWLRVQVLPRPARRWVAAGAAAVLAVAPFLAPASDHLARALLTGFAVAIAMKVRLLLDRRDVGPSMLVSAGGTLIWIALAPATVWPASREEAAQVRRQAPWRLMRAVGEALGMLALAAGVLPRVPAEWESVRVAVYLPLFYLMLSAMADGLIAVAMLAAGVRAEAAFVAPYLARSPAEFWSRRWNLPVHRFAHHYVFRPIARRAGTLPAVAAVFASSGVMHEYVVVGCVGVADARPGYMLGFFGAQGLAVVAQAWLRRQWPTLRAPGVLAVPIHLAWLVVTAPLFFRPLAPQIEAFVRACQDVCAFGLRYAARLLP